MKLTVVLLLSCMCVCYVSSVTITHWGRANNTVMGIRYVEVKWSYFKVKTNTFTFPDIRDPEIIHGITHFDFQIHPVNVTFLQGGLGQPNITIHIESQRGYGINSSFFFYSD